MVILVTGNATSRPKDPKAESVKNGHLFIDVDFVKTMLNL